jgi:peptide/nickel transport system substrate-binding protein
VISKSAAPRTFNRLLSVDDQTSSVTGCLVGNLLRINRSTQQPEPELAQSWTVSPDGRKVAFSLRRDVSFSDGHPFTADDVVFTFQVINDPRIGAPAAGQFSFQGQRVKVEKTDGGTVTFTFPIALAAPLRLFDGIPILPRAALETAYREDKFLEAWGPATPPLQIVGLGPFKLKSYVPGQRVVLERNEHYWKKSSAGEQLPYLDEIVFNIDPDRNTQLLKFQQGETDVLSPIVAANLGSLNPLELQNRIKVYDLGPSLIREILWFNLNDIKQTGTGRGVVDPIKLGWFNDVRFRQAVSHAIDRKAIVNLVYSGRATQQWSFLSEGDRAWFDPEVVTYPYDSNRARQLLAEAGFQYQADQKVLLDAQGRPVTFTLMTNSGNALRQKISALIQDDLAKIGIHVTLAAIESQALMGRVTESFDYEACLLAIDSGDLDPSAHTNILLSSGTGHWWHPNQVQPATAWEARVDDLMRQQQTALDPKVRKKLFDEVQMILSQQQPYIFLVSRHLLVAAKTDLGNFKPALLPDFVLWNCEELFRTK